MSGDRCHWCLRTGHYAQWCPDRAAGIPRATSAPVDDSPVSSAPVGEESPTPGSASGRPDWWKTSPDQSRPPEQWAKDVHAQAEAARKRLEAAGVVIERPDYRERRLRRLAAKDLYDRGRLGPDEYCELLAEIDNPKSKAAEATVTTLPAPTPATEADTERTQAA